VALEPSRRAVSGGLVAGAPRSLRGPVAGDRRPRRARAPPPHGPRSAACPHGVYPAQGPDAWVAIAVAGNAAWHRFQTALGWPYEAHLATLPQRLAVRDALDARVAAWTRERSAVDAAERLQAAGVSAFPVQGPAEHRDDPHLAARGALVRLDDPGVENVLHVANPLRFARTRLVPPAPAPRLGADTAAVLGRLLGMSPDTVRRLVADGVCR
jgi:crotonobetainyl-CoA:carnitine CoA-transferase CaiB-like acyl-CoA transferase